MEKELNELRPQKELKNFYKTDSQTIDELKFKLKAADERLVMAKRGLEKKKSELLSLDRLSIFKDKLLISYQASGNNHGFSSEK